MRNAKKRILRFRDQNFLYICLPENHRAASGRPERCAPIKTATHGTRLCNRFGLRNGFRARPAGRRPHGAGDRLRSGALSPLEQGALQRSPRGSFPPTSQGLSRSAASGGARRDRPPCRSGALRPGAVGRYDGQHPLPDRQGGSSPPRCTRSTPKTPTRCSCCGRTIRGRPNARRSTPSVPAPRSTTPAIRATTTRPNVSGRRCCTCCAGTKRCGATPGRSSNCATGFPPC